ncbi:MAG: hypothetical protein WCJ14_12515, partial [Verrucomicrobiota bacterium]
LNRAMADRRRNGLDLVFMGGVGLWILNAKGQAARCQLLDGLVEGIGLIGEKNHGQLPFKWKKSLIPRQDGDFSESVYWPIGQFVRRS